MSRAVPVPSGAIGKVLTVGDDLTPFVDTSTYIRLRADS
jgi:hypothetical protein